MADGPDGGGVKTNVDCKGAFSCAVQAVENFFGKGPDAKATLSVDANNPGMAGQAADAIANRKATLDRQMKEMGI
ncbi:MAG: hypothetical protein WC043_09200 [Pseudobdellovibrionaceae bacterium]